MSAQLPAHLQALRSRSLMQAVSGGLVSGHPRISIRANRFRLVDDAGNEEVVQSYQLDVIIIDANPHMSKRWFREAYDPNNSEGVPPTCYSDNGIGASTRASEPQSNSCQICPRNAWGSDVSRVSGKATKACNDIKKLAVLVYGDGRNRIYELDCPPATLKNLSVYTKLLASNNADPLWVVTRVTFDEETQGILKFEPVGWIDEQHASVIQSTEGKTAEYIGTDDQPVAVGLLQGAAAPQQLDAPARPQPPQVAPPMPQAPQQPQQLAPAPQQPQFQPQAQPQGLQLPPQAYTPTPQEMVQPEQAAPKKRGRPAKAAEPAAPPQAPGNGMFAAQPPAQPQGGAMPPPPPFMQGSAGAVLPTPQPAGFPSAPQAHAPQQVQQILPPEDDDAAVPAFLKKNNPDVGQQQMPQNPAFAQPAQPSPELMGALGQAFSLPTG